MATPRESSPQLIAITLVLAVAVFFVDLSMPRGFAGGIPYVALLLLGWWHHSRNYIFVLAALSTFLVVLGYIFSPAGSAEWMVISNRVMAVLAVWITAALVAAAHKAQGIRRDREQRLGLILDNSVSGIITIGEDGLILSANRAAEQIFGYAADEMIGRNVTMLMPIPYQSRHDGYIGDYLRTGEAKIIGFGREAEGLRKDGARFPIELGVSEMVMEGRRIFTGMVHDITERKQTEDQLRQALKMEAVGQLTGGVAHDFNNLLAVNISNLEMLKDHLDPGGEASKLAGRAMQAAERGALLTDRLLAFSRKQQLQPMTHHVNHLIWEMEGLLRSSLGTSVNIHMKLAENLWFSFVDAGQLENALLNLALNARDAMNGGGALTVETANITLDGEYAASHGHIKPGDYVMLTVRDTGEGMTPEVAERAFEPFFTTKDPGEGSGLGLSMVYGFASQSGGHAAIDSPAGRGASVKIYLPRADGDAPAHSPAQAGGVESGGKAQTILVVEDYDALRETAVDLLSGAGYTPLAAKDASSALDVLKQNPRVALLFTDVVLPGGMSGIELAREARRRDPALKVLLTSGYTEETIASGDGGDDQRELIEMQMIEKPYKLAHLSNKVAEILAGE